MSLYNMLFGRNSQSALLLAVVGLRENDVERFRDVSAGDDGATIAIYARTGGGNRDDYPQAMITASPLYVRDEDDDFDSTYATFHMRTPEGFAQDVLNLSDPLAHGIRPAFAQLLSATLKREPTESDKEAAAYEVERAELRRLPHSLANGHTFVPHDDAAMEGALKLAEARGGSLRTVWGILPLQLTVRQHFQPWPGAKDPRMAASITRVEVGYEWKIDAAYWAHCEARFVADYPLTMAEIGKAVASHLARAA